MDWLMVFSDDLAREDSVAVRFQTSSRKMLCVGFPWIIATDTESKSDSKSEVGMGRDIDTYMYI